MRVEASKSLTNEHPRVPSEMNKREYSGERTKGKTRGMGTTVMYGTRAMKEEQPQVALFDQLKGDMHVVIAPKRLIAVGTLA